MENAVIPFIDLKFQQNLIRNKLEARILQVLDHGSYVMGAEVFELENQLADYCGAKHVISCANGTDALQLALMCESIGPGDAVFVPSFTFAATCEAVQLVGATPVFVDICDDSYNIDPNSLVQAIDSAKAADLKLTAVISVDLFGQPADYPEIIEIAKDNQLIVIADAAQSFGSTLYDKPTGTWGDYTTTSFFPAKPLGCYGDGGAIMTDDPDKAAILKSIRIHGQGSDKYENIRLGMNSRLDTMQAAILIEKLAIFEGELKMRDRVAQLYNSGLDGHVVVPKLMDGVFSSWAQYTVCVQNRDYVVNQLKNAGIPTAIYYPRPIHTQKPYRNCPLPKNGLPVTEKRAEEVLSLPMHAYLDEETQSRIINQVRKAVKN